MIYYSMDEYPCEMSICSVCKKEATLYIIHMNTFPYTRGVKCDSTPKGREHPKVCSQECFEYFKLLEC